MIKYNYSFLFHSHSLSHTLNTHTLSLNKPAVITSNPPPPTNNHHPRSKACHQQPTTRSEDIEGDDVGVCVGVHQLHHWRGV
ncbi:hypothetical protein HanIR_Chr12g0576021 [Helianthus annuus]|nr:hypothetical protein HanIR_Chr12g0576021 [Helianthus annuus]